MDDRGAFTVWPINQLGKARPIPIVIRRNTVMFGGRKNWAHKGKMGAPFWGSGEGLTVSASWNWVRCVGWGSARLGAVR